MPPPRDSLLTIFSIFVSPGVLVTVWHIAADPCLGHMTHNPHAPVDFDLLCANLKYIKFTYAQFFDSFRNSRSHFVCLSEQSISSFSLSLLFLSLAYFVEQMESKILCLVNVILWSPPPQCCDCKHQTGLTQDIGFQDPHQQETGSIWNEENFYSVQFNVLTFLSLTTYYHWLISKWFMNI